MWSNFPLAPPSASNFAPEYDFIFYTLLALTILFTLIVGIAVTVFTIRYRRGTKVDRSRPIYEDLRLELTWTIIPLILGLIMFFFGARLFIHMKTPPPDAQEIFVIGKQWMWHAQHANGVRENNTLHVPVGRPVKLTMISQDVIHAFYIPAFRVQYHVVPGRYTQMWFTATKAGVYHLFCGMYCGTQHSEMGGKVVAMDPKDWANWIANGGNTVPPMTMEQAGHRLYNRLSCNNCHGAESNLRAPSLYGIYNSKRSFANGGAAIADDTYIRESILRPHNRLTQGYGPTMPAYEGQLSEEDVLNLIAYIRNIGGMANPATPSPTNMQNVPVQSARTNGQNPLSYGAMQFDNPSSDPTPTNRTTNPSVGAIAAEDRGDR
jgi:cytochrome c oxidase subunit 2